MEKLELLNPGGAPPIGNALLLCNRSAARAAMGRFREAVNDATAALSEQPDFGQAQTRLEKAVQSLNRAEAFQRGETTCVRDVGSQILFPYPPICPQARGPCPSCGTGARRFGERLMGQTMHGGVEALGKADVGAGLL